MSTQIGEIKQILRDLIKFETVSRSPNIKAVDYLADKAKKLGFSCQRIFHPKDSKRANLLCQIGPQNNSGLMLSGHTDVVPCSDQNWHTDPFELTESETSFIGRGTTDMKGFIAACLHALSKINLEKLEKNIVLLWTYDEEIGCKGSKIAAPQLKNFLPELPKFGIIGEPTEFSILRMHSGHATVRVRARGKGAHSSDPKLGVSAIRAMNKAMTGIYEFETKLSEEKILPEFFDKPWVSLNIGKISGGTAVNIIPDYCEILLGFRPLPGCKSQEIFERLEEYAKKYIGPNNGDISLELQHISPPLFTREDTKLERIIMPYVNNSKKINAANFSTDAGNLSEQGIECLVFGPGSINIAHQANEYVKKQDLIQASEKLQKIIMNFCVS